MDGSVIDDDWKFGSASNGVRTVVLVGRTGDGKSATGNSILGRKEFKSMNSPDGITNNSELQTTVLEDGQIINVIDTPGLFNKSVEPEFVEKEIVRCIDMAKDGIHAVLVVVSLSSRVSTEEAAALETFQKLFGDKIAEYMIMVFTHGDDLEMDEVNFDDYLSHSESIKGMLEICGNRRVLFDNKTKNRAKKAEQLKQLLSLVDNVVMKNGGKPYTSELFVESKIGTKLRETTQGLEQQLAEEQDARLKAEETAREAQVNSENEIRKLRENLERNRRQAEELKRRGRGRGCHMM